MIVTITHMELKSIGKVFRLAALARKIVRQLKGNENCIKYKTHGFWTDHYTLTLWKSREAMEEFHSSSAHKKALAQRAKIAKTIRTFSYEDDELPTWDEVKVLLPEGKALSFS